MLLFLLSGGQWVGVRTHTHTHAKHPKDTSLCIFLQASPVSQFGIGKQTPIVRIPVLSQKGWQNPHH